MAGKRAYLISCLDHYKDRGHIADKCLRANGFETVFITSTFDHTAKQEFTCKVPGCVQIAAKPYRKNLSLARILSHQRFARDVFRYLENLEEQPEVLSVQLPPNFLAHYAARYKRRHPDVKLIFDIFDLWPETFPGGRIKKLLAPVFSVWAAIRDRNLGAADFVMTECEMYRQKLKLPEETSKTVWLSAEKPKTEQLEPQLRSDALELCYLGSINNIIDIPAICGLVRKIAAQKPVVLHIIGKGERQQEFADEAKAAGAEVIFYGPIYDDTEKMRIMSRCHFGLNIMKPSVCVGLTMKSVDYFRFGLPIINSIPADTEKLVRERGIGVQLDADCAETVLRMTNEDNLQLRKNVTVVFEESFFEARIVEQYQMQLEQVLR